MCSTKKILLHTIWLSTFKTKKVVYCQNNLKNFKNIISSFSSKDNKVLIIIITLLSFDETKLMFNNY